MSIDKKYYPTIDSQHINIIWYDTDITFLCKWASGNAWSHWTATIATLSFSIIHDCEMLLVH